MDFLEFHPNCPYCDAGTRNGNQHDHACLAGIPDLVRDNITYAELRTAWRAGAKLALTTGTWGKDWPNKLADPRDRAHELGAMTAHGALLRGRDAAMRVAYYLDVPEKDIAQRALA